MLLTNPLTRAERYAQVRATDEAQACLDKIRNLPSRHKSTCFTGTNVQILTHAPSRQRFIHPEIQQGCCSRSREQSSSSSRPRRQCGWEQREV